MKNLLLAIPLVAFLSTSCQQSAPVVQTLPPVVVEEEKKVVVAKKRLPKRRKPVAKKPVEKVPEEVVSPLTPDPTEIVQVAEIPRFEVPENIQPEVLDGINQAEFIELKW